MSQDTWIPVTDPLEGDDLKRAQDLLNEQEIESTVDEGRLLVAPEHQDDAAAVLAGLEETADEPPPVDRAKELAELTAPVTRDYLSPWFATELAMRLLGGGIRATTDVPSQTIGLGMEVSAQCRVLVRPEDLPRACEIASDKVGDEGACRDRVRASTIPLLPMGTALRGEAVTAVHTMLDRAGVASYWFEAHAAGEDDQHPGWEVRVAKKDEEAAHMVLQRLSQAVADSGAAKQPAPDDSPAAKKKTDMPEEPSPTASLLLFAVLALAALLVWRSCS